MERFYGIHRTYVGAAEPGERKVSILMAVRFATVYGADPGSLVKGLRHTPDLWPFDQVQPYPLPPPGGD